MKVTINLNENVKFKFKELGRVAWKQYYPNNVYKTDENGFCMLELWRLMAIIGPHIEMGEEPPIETDIQFGEWS